MKHIRKGILVLLVLSMLLPLLPAMAEDSFGEAPAFAELVAQGLLPRVEDRLPEKEDIMIEPTEEIGKYGGSLAITTNDGGRWNWGPYSEQSMFRFKQDGSGEVEPNIAKAFYANEDYTVWTIELRKGMKWSDGQPLTADDIIFYYDHMSVPALNEDRSQKSPDAEGYYNCYTSKPYNCFQSKIGDVSYWAKADKIDDFTVTFTFASPKYTFPIDVAVDNKWMVLPKHFFVNFVARKDGVADDPTFPLITEEQAIENANKAYNRAFENYTSMGKAIGYYHWDYYIVPQVRSFIPTQDNWNKVGEVYEMVRNPYFFKTDAAGNQLPYLDSIKVYIINEEDQAILKAMAGELDYFNVPNHSYSAIASAVKDTHYIMNQGMTDWTYNSGKTIAAIQLNQTVKDLDKRALFQNPDFRQALSICVDRDLLSITLSNGLAEPAQAAVSQGSFGYDEEWYYKWTDYDVDKANELLDALTEPWDRKEGTFRKMKGTDKELEIIVSVKEVSKEGDMLVLLKSAYAQIGVKLSEKVDSQMSIAILSNDVEAELASAAVSSPLIRPDAIIPMRNFCTWCSAYGKWYEDGKSEANGGIKPEGDMLKLIECYETIKYYSGADRDEVVNAAIKEVYNLHKENCWIIGYLSAVPNRFIVNNELRNMPESILNVDEFRFNGLNHFEQVWRDAQ